MNAPTVKRASRYQIATMALGVGLATAPFATSCASRPSPRGAAKPIRGSWISIWWDDRRHHYWNDTCLNYTAEQWGMAVKEVAEIGMEYLVLLAIAKDSKAYAYLSERLSLGPSKDLRAIWMMYAKELKATLSATNLDNFRKLGLPQGPLVMFDDIRESLAIGLDGQHGDPPGNPADGRRLPRGESRPSAR